MKKLIIVASVALALTCRAEKEEFGGTLRIVPKDAGTFLFVNAQKRVPAAPLAEVAARLNQSLSYDIRFAEGVAPTLETVPASLRALNAKGALWFVDDPKLPRLLAACEDGWAIVNVAALAEGADVSKLQDRLLKESLRAFGFIHGTSDPIMMPACVMKPAVGLDALDALACKEFSPMTESKIGAYLSEAGYKNINIGTYYDACEEGWAPAPTNAVQQRIWDKVHQLPTKPIKISPESKR